MFGLHIADLLVVFLYLVLVVGIGVYTSRMVSGLSSFVMPRRFGKFTMIMFSFGSGTSSDQAVSVASKSFTNGLSGIWYQWLYLFATPFYWLIAPVMRRFRAITMSDVFEARYNRSVGILYGAIAVANLMVMIGLMLKGSSAVIEACTGGSVPEGWAIILMAILFVGYGMAGGLSAAIITDLLQGVLTIAFSVMLLPLVFNAVGGMAGMRAAIDDPEMMSLVAPGEIGVFYILIIALNGLVGIVAQPHILSNCAAGRTELDGAWGFMGGNLIKRFCTVAWSLIGLAALAHYGTAGMDPDQIFGRVARDFLSPLMPGLVGLFLSALIASVMSSCDAFMVAGAGLFAGNIYKPLAPSRSDRHYVTVVRWASLFVVAAGLAFAYWVPGVIDALEIFWKVSPMMGIAFWMGLLWRRANAVGAWASTLAALFAWWLSAQGFFVDWVSTSSISGPLRLVFVEAGQPEIHLPWQMVFYMTAGVAAGIVASLVTKPLPEAKVDHYYALTRTPVTAGEVVDVPCTLPAGANVPPARLMFPGTSLEIPVPSRVAMAGFIVGWLFVVLIIGGTWILTQM
jgi:Na+/proline symporter